MSLFEEIEFEKRRKSVAQLLIKTGTAKNHSLSEKNEIEVLQICTS